MSQYDRKGKEFAERYYLLFDGEPHARSRLLELYENDARVSWNGNGISVSGLQKAIAEWPPKSTHTLQSIDVQHIPNDREGSLLMLISGAVDYEKDTSRVFTQQLILSASTMRIISDSYRLL